MRVFRSPALLLQPINHNPGLLPIKEGQALLSNDKWSLVKILDLSLIREDLELNVNRYNELNIQIDSYYGNRAAGSEVNDLRKQTDYTRNLTIQKFSQLLPLKRLKRGILNPLGSIIKLVTGNLDNDDALRYDSLINDVKKSQNAVEKKMTVVAEMLESFTNVSNTVKHNFVQLERAIVDLQRQLNNTKLTTINELRVTIVYSMFLHNFETLYIRLDEIETSIAFSKLGTLHQSLVDTNELLSLLKSIEIHSKLVFPATLDNIFRLEQCIELKVYAKENQITFIMDIPLVDNDIYSYYKIVPLPITNSLNQTTIVLPKYPFLLVKGLKTVPLLHPCKEVDESVFLCEEDYTPLTMKDVCVTQLMNFAANVTACRPILVEFEDAKVEKIQTNRWMLYTKFTLLITENCGGEMSHHYLQGTYIITANDDCEAIVNGLTLRRRQGKLERKSLPALPIINLPGIHPPATAEQEPRPVNLDEVDLTNLKYLSQVLASSESVSAEKIKNTSEYESVVNTRKISIWTLLLYILLIIAIIIYVKKSLYCNRISNICIRNSQEENSPENFELTVGGVMHSGNTVTIQA